MCVNEKPVDSGYMQYIYSISKASSIHYKMHISTIYGPITDPHIDHHPVGLTAQPLEHCNCITEVRIGIPSRPEFFRPFLRYCLSDTASLQSSLTLKENSNNNNLTSKWTQRTFEKMGYFRSWNAARSWKDKSSRELRTSNRAKTYSTHNPVYSPKDAKVPSYTDRCKTNNGLIVHWLIISSWVLI